MVNAAPPPRCQRREEQAWLGDLFTVSEFHHRFSPLLRLTPCTAPELAAALREWAASPMPANTTPPPASAEPVSIELAAA